MDNSATQTNSAQQAQGTARPPTREDALISYLELTLAPLGYTTVHVEAESHRQKTLRVFIDRTDGQGVGIEDCVVVTKALDEPLETYPQLDQWFKGPYELEVSSPGIDRPLRTEADFAKFSGRKVKIHTFRPLTEGETQNAEYSVKNPKQKNFLGRLEGMAAHSVRLTVEKNQILIPWALISKANLEPEFDFDSNESE